MISVTTHDCARCRYASKIGWIFVCNSPDRVCRGAM